MKRWVLLLLVLLLSVSSFAAEKILFEDDFKDDLDDSVWFTTSDSWVVEGGALVFPEVGFGDIFAGEEDWEDYAVECEILPLVFGQYGSVRLFFRSNELWVGYGVAFHPDGYLVHMFEGNWDKNVELKRGSVPTFPAGKPIKVRIEVKKNLIKVIANDEVLFDDKDPEDMYFEGMFGFRADHASCQIKNVKVYKL